MKDKIDLNIVKVKKRRSKKKISPLSKSYSQFLKKKKVNDHQKKGETIADIRINVIKKDSRQVC